MEKTINKSWKVELKKAIKELLLEQNENQQKEESEYHDVLHAPYITGFSEKLARDLKQIKIGVTFQKEIPCTIPSANLNLKNIQMTGKILFTA